MKVRKIVTKEMLVTVCDLCEKVLESQDEVDVHVKFLTEQTEGKDTTPYIIRTKIDMCGTCHQRYLDNLPILGRGAMGHNTYNWNNK